MPTKASSSTKDSQMNLAISVPSRSPAVEAPKIVKKRTFVIHMTAKQSFAAPEDLQSKMIVETIKGQGHCAPFSEALAMILDHCFSEWADIHPSDQEYDRKIVACATRAYYAGTDAYRRLLASLRGKRVFIRGYECYDSFRRTIEDLTVAICCQAQYAEGGFVQDGTQERTYHATVDRHVCAIIEERIVSGMPVRPPTYVTYTRMSQIPVGGIEPREFSEEVYGQMFKLTEGQYKAKLEVLQDEIRKAIGGGRSLI